LIALGASLGDRIRYRTITRGLSVRINSPLKNVVVLGLVVLSLSVVITGCPSGGGGGGGGGIGDAEVATAVDAVMSTIGVFAAGAGDHGPSGVTSSGQTSPQTYTFSGAVDPLTGYTLSGTLVSTFPSTDVSPFPIAMDGTLTLTGAPVTTVVLDIGFSLNPVAASMTRSGTVTVDGTAFDFAALDVTAGKAGESSPLLQGVWKSTDEDASIVFFVLPGNFVFPMLRDATANPGPYTDSAPLAIQYNAASHRFYSHDGDIWATSGGFSTDGNTMAMSVWTDDGPYFVFYGGDGNTWYDNQSWRHIEWSLPRTNSYVDLTYTINGTPAPGGGAVTIDYSGYIEVADGTGPGRSGTLTTTVDTATKEIEITADEGDGSDPDLLVDTPPMTVAYTTMDDYLVISLAETTDAAVAIFQRQ
jgi:hypothetical protein